MTEVEGAIVVPEDQGTGVSPTDADWTSSGHVAGLSGQLNASNYVENGFSFVNLDDGTFDITGGLAFLYYEDGVDVQDRDGEYTRDWDQPVTFAVRADMTTGLEYEVGQPNDVFLDVDLTDGNGAEYLVTLDEVPDPPFLKLGIIDSALETLSFNEDGSGGDQYGPFESVSFVEEGEGTNDTADNIEVVSFTES